MAWTEGGRRQFYIDKYGEEDGLVRFAEWQTKHQSSDESEPEPQAGAVWVDIQPAKPRRSRSTTSRSRTKKAPTITPDEAAPQYAVAIAVVDEAFARVDPRWASVPRLTGGDAIIERYLQNLFSSDEPEVDRLAAVIAEVGKENKWLAAALQMGKKYGSKAGPWLKLATVWFSIFVPRLIAMGVIPANIFGGGENDSADMESRGAHGDSGNDREREVGADELPTGSVPYPVHSTKEQSRFGQVSWGANGNNGASDKSPQREPLGTETGL